MENNHHSADPLSEAVNWVAQSAEQQIHRAEVYTRRSPLAALAIAAASGYVLRSLPVRALVGLFVRLALVLARPFMFILGAVNLYQLVKTQTDQHSGQHTDKL